MNSSVRKKMFGMWSETVSHNTNCKIINVSKFYEVSILQGIISKYNHYNLRHLLNARL